MNVLRVTASMDPSMGGPPQGIRNSIGELERLCIRNEVVSCDAPDAAWLGRDDFPIHALGPGKYGFAYTSRLGPWLEENLARFDAVIVHGLWLWPSFCATRAVRRRRLRDQETKRLRGEEAEQVAGDRRQETGGPMGAVLRKDGVSVETGEARGIAELKDRNAEELNHHTKHLRCFVMPHGMLDPWFQRDRSRRVKAVRNWFYWWLVERNVVNSADALLFTCQQELELARTTFGGYRPRREINVGYGIAEPPTFEPKMREAFAEKCPGVNGRPYLLFMSRIHAKKNVAALVRAYARVRSEVTSDEWRVTSGLFPDLVIAGPGWDSGYGRRIKELIRKQGAGSGEMGVTERAETEGLRAEVGPVEYASHSTGQGGVTGAENRADAWGDGPQAKLNTEHFGRVHAVDMLAGDSKWGALYGCEAFVLPSHQENFGIAVVEALACGKPVLISDQVNIWREIVEDGAGIAEADTEEGVEKLLRKFFEAWTTVASIRSSGHESPQLSELISPSGKPAARLSHSDNLFGCRGNLSSALRSIRSNRFSLQLFNSAPRVCYLERFAIGPAAVRLSEGLKQD